MHDSKLLLLVADVDDDGGDREFLVELAAADVGRGERSVLGELVAGGSTLVIDQVWKEVKTLIDAVDGVDH